MQFGCDDAGELGQFAVKREARLESVGTAGGAGGARASEG